MAAVHSSGQLLFLRVSEMFMLLKKGRETYLLQLKNSFGMNVNLNDGESIRMKDKVCSSHFE